MTKMRLAVSLLAAVGLAFSVAACHDDDAAPVVTPSVWVSTSASVSPSPSTSVSIEPVPPTESVSVSASPSPVVTVSVSQSAVPPTGSDPGEDCDSNDPDCRPTH